MATVATLSSLIFLCLSLLSYCPSTANITPGSSLSTTDNNSSWFSPSGVFAFGFHKLNNSDLFLVAVWFNKIPQRTIVWYANGDNPAPRGSTLELTTSGLVLNDPGGQKILFPSPASAEISITEAAMLDTGNFVLTGNGSNFVWESFKNPTDTILPNQTLDLGSKLFSKLTETNFSKGRFELHFDNGNVQLRPVAWPGRFLYDSYYSSETSRINSSESGNKFVFDASGAIYIVTANGEIAQLALWDTKSPGVSQYYRATLDFDGVFTHYAYASSSQSWWSFRLLPKNICTDIFSGIGSGACGFNSYCSIQNGRPSCNCPPRYVFVDPNNRFMGCRPEFRQGCGGDEGSRDPSELYEFRELNNVNWPLGDYERLEPYDQKDCEQSCIYDCSCAVAIYNGTASCWKKRLPLSNGRYEETGFSKVLFKVRKGGFGDNSGSRRGGRPILSVAILLGSSVFFNVILLVAIFLVVYMWHKKKAGNDVQDSSMSDTNMLCFTYKELEEATNGFKEELGRGAFGIVYKGVLKTGSKNAVAVKKLDKLAQEREREFKTELSAIGRTHHKNLVQLLGFCDEGVHRILVYEFMSHGTLANLLFTIPKPDWYLRVRITLEIVKGLVYLHEECNVPIIHCDIKPQNILLDQHFIAKISDFGLSKLLLSNQSQTRTMIRGTRGYVAPEWFKNVSVTAKVDVFSFGVMLLEIICCRRCVEMEFEEEKTAILTDWVYECYVEGRLDVLVDNDETAMADKGRLHKWLMIAIWCIQENPAERPAMKMVMQMLEGFLEVPRPPCPSSFSLSVED